jgi:hypothetical protein
MLEYSDFIVFMNIHTKKIFLREKINRIEDSRLRTPGLE